ncbi:MAG: hypothetical protein LUD15_06710 [Bacteroides sp.]|nr:hypothetical protein [Bacteroides sp.]
MKQYKTFAILCIVLFSLQARADFTPKGEIEDLLFQLDTLIAHKNYFAAVKEARIEQLRKSTQGVRSSEERYWIHKIFMTNILSIMPTLPFIMSIRTWHWHRN